MCSLLSCLKDSHFLPQKINHVVIEMTIVGWGLGTKACMYTVVHVQQARRWKKKFHAYRLQTFSFATRTSSAATCTAGQSHGVFNFVQAIRSSAPIAARMRMAPLFFTRYWTHRLSAARLLASTSAQFAQRTEHLSRLPDPLHNVVPPPPPPLLQERTSSSKSATRCSRASLARSKI